MKIESLYRYYVFGYNYNTLLLSSHEFSNYEAYKQLTKYLDFIDKLELKVTSEGIKLNLLYIDVETVKKLAESPTEKNKLIEKSLCDSIKDKLKKIDAILDAELNTKMAYLTEDKRYSSDFLSKNISKLFAKDVFTYATTIAQYDFQESGLCILFDRYTAAAFHALRGTEDILKMYYQKLLSKVAKESDTWGTYVNGINKEIQKGIIKPPPTEELMGNLDHLREYYRNRTDHPDRIYNSDQAQDLFSLCTKTVNDMIQDLLERKLLESKLE